jgi:Flp pilus assembly protein TadB
MTVSKERARLRAQRLAEAQAARAVRDRRRRRREWWRATVRRMIPRLPDRRSGRLVRRTPSQRAMITVTVAGVLFMVWKFVPSLSLKIALTLLIAAVTPVAVLLTFDRRNRSWL